MSPSCLRQLCHMLTRIDVTAIKHAGKRSSRIQIFPSKIVVARFAIHNKIILHVNFTFYCRNQTKRTESAIQIEESFPFV